MKWSRTETVNMWRSISDAMRQSVTGRRGQPREHGGQLLERAFACHERVELGVCEQLHDELHAPRMTPARALRRGDGADLRRLERETPAVERAAERHGRRIVAIPARFDDRRFDCGKLERSREPGAAAAR